MERPRAPENDGPSKSSIDSEPARDGSSPLESLFTYPSLQRLFEENSREAIDDMRARLKRTHDALERVIRQGPPRDAARAARVAEAYDLTLELLTELELLGRNKSGSKSNQ